MNVLWKVLFGVALMSAAMIPTGCEEKRETAKTASMFDRLHDQLNVQKEQLKAEPKAELESILNREIEDALQNLRTGYVCLPDGKIQGPQTARWTFFPGSVSTPYQYYAMFFGKRYIISAELRQENGEWKVLRLQLEIRQDSIGLL